jgi:hypothetical protein
MEKQEQQLTKITRHIHQQDSVITKLTDVNSSLQMTIHKQDSIMQHQNIIITNYEKAIDSLTVIMRFLERSDLQNRYGPRP